MTRSWERGMDWILPQSEKEPTLLTLQARITSLQNWERNPCSFTGSSLVLKAQFLGLFFLCLYSSLLKDLIQSCGLNNIYRLTTNNCSSNRHFKPNILVLSTWSFSQPLLPKRIKGSVWGILKARTQVHGGWCLPGKPFSLWHVFPLWWCEVCWLGSPAHVCHGPGNRTAGIWREAI